MVYESYDSYGSWNNDLRVVQFVKCISLERLRMYIQVHDSYGSLNNGLRVVRLAQVVKQWFTSRTVFELHINRGTFGLSRFENEEYSSCFASCSASVCKYLCSSPIVRLVNHCFTICTGRRSRTSRVKPFTSRICSTVLDKDGAQLWF